MGNRLRRLGNSELWLSPLGLGAWQFSGGQGIGSKFWKGLSQAQVTKIIEISLAGGINWIDTAEAYGHGMSEQMIARSLDSIEENSKNNEYTAPYLANKWWPLGRKASSITRTISIRRAMLGERIITLYQIHHPTSISSLQSQMEKMTKLVENKDIRYVGVSNFSAKQMRKAHTILNNLGLTLVSNQVRYNLFDRSIETNGILDTAKELGIAIIAYSPLHQGLLTGKFHKEPERIKQLFWLKRVQYGFTKKNLEKTEPLIKTIEKIAIQHNATLAQIALAWLITANGETVFAIPGASNQKQVEGNLKAMQLCLSDKEITLLSKASNF
jgi:aryl-alcohol dehydrogenase-like predicted oxidoreductase